MKKEAMIGLATGSMPSSLNFKAFAKKPESLIINNENFVTTENDVVMSLNPRGIVFVPSKLTELKIDMNVEVIYMRAFERTNMAVI